MDWNNKKQAQLDELRQREAVGILTASEQKEFETLMASLTQAANDALVPAIHRLQQKQAKLEKRLEQQQYKNEKLAKQLLQDQGRA